MPKGPQGQRRPADVIGAAIKVAKIATGELEEEINGKEYARKGGLKGGPARAKKLSAKKRNPAAILRPNDTRRTGGPRRGA